jgi:large subunit ribosomal protein L21
MYAILQHGGHQYRVASGDRILVDRIPVEVGSTVTLESVLLLGDGAETDVAKGSPVEASVTATVIAHRRGRKIRVFTYKPKKRHRRTLGHRSQLTELLIDEVGRGKAAAKPKATAPKRAASKPAAKADVVEAETEAVAAEAEAIAVAAEAVEAEVAVAELAVEEAVEEAAEAAESRTETAAAKPAAPKRPRTPRAKKDSGDGA